MVSWSHIDFNSMTEGDAEISKTVMEVAILYFGKDTNNKINNGKPLSENQTKKFLEWVLREVAAIPRAQSSNSVLCSFAALKQKLLKLASKKERKKKFAQSKGVSFSTSEKKSSAVGIPFKKKTSPHAQLKLQEIEVKKMDQIEDLLNSLNITSTTDENLEDAIMED